MFFGSERKDPTQNNERKWALKRPLFDVQYHQILRRPEGKYRECITIAVRPTADDEDKPVVPFGAWEIEIDGRTLRASSDDMSQNIYLRVHRDDGIRGGA